MQGDGIHHRSIKRSIWLMWLILEGCCFKGCEKNNVSVEYLYLENPIDNLIFTFNEIDADFMHYILNHDNNEKNPEDNRNRSFSFRKNTWYTPKNGGSVLK